MAFNIDEERLKALFYYTSDGVIFLDPELNILMINPSAEEITGWNSKEIAGKKFPLNHLIGLNTAGIENKVDDFFSPTGTNMNLEMEITLPQGNKVHIPAISFPVVNEKGNPFYGLLLENILLKYGMGEKLIKTERMDDITGLYNRTYFEQAADEEIKRLRKHGGKLGAILVHVENVPSIYNRFGKSKGDELMKKAGEIVKGNSREVDLVGRYGESDLIILLIHSDQHKMTAILSRLREKVVLFNQNNPLTGPLKIKVGKVLLDRDYEEIFRRVKLSIENFV